MVSVSVIIPCYNHGRFIQETIDSVMSQSYQDFEIIIINDGSTDKFTNELLANYKQVKTVVYTISNHGLPYARNYGIGKSTGKYIFPLDADDKITQDCFEKMILAFNANEKLGVVGSNVEFFGAESSKTNIKSFNLNEFLVFNQLTASCMYKKECWEKVGGYDEDFNQGMEDYDFWLSLLEADYKIEVLPEHLFLYRRHEKESMTNNMSSSLKYQIHQKIIKKHRDLYKNNASVFLEKIYTLNDIAKKKNIDAKNYKKTLKRMVTLNRVLIVIVVLFILERIFGK